MKRSQQSPLGKRSPSPEASAIWDDDEFAAPASPYDGPDDGWPEDMGEASDGPRTVLRGPADSGDVRALGFWRPVLATCAVPFAEAAAGLARLDERLRIMPAPERTAARERLAALQACRLMWAEGVIVAPEAVALDALDRRGRARADAPAVSAARSITRRLAREPGRKHARPAREAADPDVGGPDWSDAGSCDATEFDAALRDAPPLVAAAFALPYAGPLSDAARLDASAARLIAAARGCRGGALFAPVPARRRLAGPAPETRLAAFLGDVADGARDASAMLDDLAAWRARADADAASMKGKTPARVVALLAARPALSASAAASALRLSDDAALRVLTRLAEAGLARELTGHSRFRVWAARI